MTLLTTEIIVLGNLHLSLNVAIVSYIVLTIHTYIKSWEMNRVCIMCTYNVHTGSLDYHIGLIRMISDGS